MRTTLLFFNGAVRPDCPIAKALSQGGYRVVPCVDTVALRRELLKGLALASAGHPPVLALLAADAVRNAAAATALAAYPQVGVLIQLDHCDDNSLLSVFQLGVDAWCPRHCSAQTLLLALHNLQRRLESSHQTVSVQNEAEQMQRMGVKPNASADWQLEEQGWRMRAPSGKVFNLTSSERALVLGLLISPKHSLSYEGLIKHIRWQGDAPGDRTRLAVLVSRLRRKMVVQGEQMPLKSVRGWGYMLSSPLQKADECVD